RKRLLDWLHHKLRPPFTPANFTTDWTDGIRLCALCEVISPGACPRYDLLSPANALSNIKLALSLIEAYLNVKPASVANAFDMFMLTATVHTGHHRKGDSRLFQRSQIGSPAVSDQDLLCEENHQVDGHLL